MTTIQPSEAALRWAGGGTTPARVVRRLAGGTHAVTHLLEGGSPKREMVLTHYDFWSGNVLWQGREITGVVDWSGALGRTDLTAAALRSRHTAWAHHCTALQQ